MTSAYTPSQVSAWLNHIQLPQSFHPSASPPPPLDLQYLHLLHVHQLSAIPYDNLSIHYSSTHAISLDPQVVYDKIMAGRGRGGYCMENSIFYYHMLRALGFRVYMTGVKIRLRDSETRVPMGDYIGWTHMVNIVTLPHPTSPTNSASQRYMIDVSFGGDGATVPVPLDPSPNPPPISNLGSQQIRLLHSHIPPQTDLSLPKRWIYQYRNSTAAPWNDFYAFATELEFVAADFEIMSWFASSSPTSFQTYTPMVIKFLRGPAADGATEVSKDEDGISNNSAEPNTGKIDPLDDVDEAPAAAVHRAVSACNERITGKVMLVKGTVKRNLGGKTETVAVCRTEAERVKALKDWFGIELTEEERLGIAGSKVCLAWE